MRVGARRVGVSDELWDERGVAAQKSLNDGCPNRHIVRPNDSVAGPVDNLHLHIIDQAVNGDGVAGLARDDDALDAAGEHSEDKCC